MNYDDLSPDQLVGLLSHKSHRGQAIIALVGGITTAELRKVKVNESARTALVQGLKHPDSLVRWWCIQLMDHLADERYIEPLLEAAMSDPLPRNRHHAIHALTCEICKPDRGKLNADLRAALTGIVITDEDWSVRMLALQEFTKIAGHQATEQLISQLPGQDQATLKAFTQSRNASKTLQTALACTHSLNSWRGQLAYKLLNAADDLIQAAMRLLTGDDLSAVQHRLRHSQELLLEAETAVLDH